MDITDELENDRGTGFVTLDKTMLSRKPLFGKLNKPPTSSRHNDRQKLRDAMNISTNNLETLERTLSRPREDTFIVSAINTKKTPMGGLPSKISCYRTLEEARVQTSGDQPDAPRQI